MKPIIVAEGVYKKYSRNANAHLSYGVTDLMTEVFGKGPRERLRTDEFFALNDVSFHMYPGESLGLIGRNGSGKSTLLKTLNGLVKIDKGQIIVDGRVQALINLNAGFNFQLSGRDNIYNSAALMGFSRKETVQIVDEVVEFAELEDFIDSPVHTYSSGMKARLGFAVAVHLRPQILLVDEVLSVGDSSFQNKCSVRMHQLRKEGATLVLVSHSPTHIVQICERALWLHKGKVMQMGPAKDTMRAYLEFLDEEEKARAQQLKHLRDEETKRRIKAAAEGSRTDLYGPLYDDLDRVDEVDFRFLVNGKEAEAVAMHEALEIEYEFLLKDRVTELNVSLVFFTKEGMRLTAISTLNGDLLKHIHEGRVRCRVSIPDLNLAPGQYVIVMPIHEGQSYLHRDVVKEFVVTSGSRLAWHYLDFRYEYGVENDPHPAPRATGAVRAARPVREKISGLIHADLPTIVAFSKQHLDADGGLSISGWCLSPKAIEKVEVSMDGKPLGVAQHPLLRMDVFKAHPEYGNDKSGFQFEQQLGAEVNRVAICVTAYAEGAPVGRKELIVRKDPTTIV